MAYADIQNKVGQIQMANRVLLAQRMNPNKTPETDLSGFQEQGGYIDQETIDDLQKADKEKKLDPRTISNRKKKEREKNKERLKNLPPDADIQTEGNMKGQVPPEDIFGPDYEGGPTYLRQLLQIGGAAGSLIPAVGGNILRMLIGNPNAMAMNFEDALPRGGFIGTERTNIFINDGGEAYIREPNGNFKFDGFYDPARHGPVFPQAKANDDMKIAKLPHSPPTEKIVLPNGKLMDSPLRFKTDQERIKFMEDFSRGYGRYS